MATELGVYRSVHPVPRASTEGSRDSVRFEATEFRDIARLALAKDGALWLASPGALLRSNGARFDSLRIPGDRAVAAADLIPDDTGDVWFAAQRTVWRVTPGASAVSPASAVWDSIPLTLPDGVVIRCLASEDPSTLWIGTSGGLCRLRDGEWMRRGKTDGLRDDFVRALGFGREGSLWSSNDARGVARFSGEALVGFRELETDADVHCSSAVVARDQRVYATTARRGVLEMRDGIGALVPGSLAPEFDDINYCLVQDKHEDWWSGSAFGLFHMPGPELDFRRARRVDPVGGPSASSASATTSRAIVSGSAARATRSGRPISRSAVDLDSKPIESPSPIRSPESAHSPSIDPAAPGSPASSDSRSGMASR